MSAACQGCLPHPFPGAEIERCGRAETRLYRLGCQHEHIHDRWLCAVCAAPQPDVRDYCQYCFDADGHICDVAVTPAPPPAVTP